FSHPAFRGSVTLLRHAVKSQTRIEMGLRNSTRPRLQNDQSGIATAHAIPSDTSGAIGCIHALSFSNRSRGKLHEPIPAKTCRKKFHLCLRGVAESGQCFAPLQHAFSAILPVLCCPAMPWA